MKEEKRAEMDKSHQGGKMEETKRVDGPRVGAIYKALSYIMADVNAVSKDRENKFQHYQFRGIDDIMNELHPLFAKHQVLLIPQMLECENEEKVTEVEGKQKMSYIRRVTMEYCFVSAVDGSEIRVMAEGEGFDTSDKAKPKAITMALKPLLVQMFLIPTADATDAEEDNIEHGVPATDRKPAPQTTSKGGNGQKPAAQTETKPAPTDGDEFRADLLNEIKEILDRQINGKPAFAEAKRSEIKLEVKKARSLAAIAEIKKTLAKEYALIEEESKPKQEVKDEKVA